jgi:hypothetical protein
LISKVIYKGGFDAFFDEVLMLIIAVICKWQDCYAAAWCEVSDYFEVARVHQLYEVFHDDVYAVFMEVAVVAEAE